MVSESSKRQTIPDVRCRHGILLHGHLHALPEEPAAPNGLCTPCMEKLGVIEMPPAHRRANPCVKCNALEFARVIPREHTIEAGSAIGTSPRSRR
jgi:hypothetical protein